MADAQSARPIAITGATGFIGLHVQRQLLDAGYPLRCLIRSNGANLVEGAQPQAADLASIPSLVAALEHASAVVYLAGSVRGRTPGDFQPANVDGVANTAHVLARHYPNTPMLLVSSLAASAPELSHYAQSKAAGERALQESAHEAWTILRPPAVYGEGDKELRATFEAIRRGLVPMAGPAHQRLPFIEVTDLAAAILAWVGNPEPCYRQTYAIDDGAANGYDWPTITKLIAPPQHVTIPVPYPLLRALGSVNLALSKVAGYPPMLTPGKARELSYLGWSCSNEAYTATTGWHPRIALDEGVRRLFAGSSKN